ncbi:HIT family protein [Marinilactibacillus sp. 15R]|uniref:Histidine triad (HIT) family protein n=1 Tax=Marinilactibacillus piezotolerans TaxID=258723 RepID=A0A1I4BV08_9LACT|nr:MULTISPECIES: HIT family protein [Marinilactibacillus]API89090.1 HIT family protein [Marinilactibacillus sp. 15R]SFK72628.1 histidine triad (HIT) family protein [Marinilactibacillus piezotolerans]
MTDNVFAKIVAGEIPARKIYENEHVIAIMDLSQVTKGHTLVITKKQVRNIFDYDEELASNVFAAIPKIAKAIKNHNPEVKGLNILMNNEAVASQTVFHSHIHLLPRYGENDGFGLKWEDHSSDYTSEELDDIKANLIKALEGVK